MTPGPGCDPEGVLPVNRHAAARRRRAISGAPNGGAVLLAAILAGLVLLSSPSLAAPRPAANLPAADHEQSGALVVACCELMDYHPEVFGRLVSIASKEMPVLVVAANSKQQREALALLGGAGAALGNVRFVRSPLDTMWVRDYGGFFLRTPAGGMTVLDAGYVALEAGGRRRDDRFPRRLAGVLGAPVRRTALTLDGGNVLTNGDGLCAVSETLIEENVARSHRTAPAVRKTLRLALAQQELVVLEPLAGEGTGHVDMFLTFPAVDAAVVGRYDPKDDPVNAAILDRNARRLAGKLTSRGPMKVYRVPMPSRDGGVWRSYTNVVLLPRTILVPTYRGQNPRIEREAMKVLATASGRRAVGINADSLIASEGALHCVTLGLPRARALDAALAGSRPGAFLKPWRRVRLARRRAQKANHDRYPGP